MRSLFPHSIGHWLGRDVHDCGAVPSTRPLAPGAVLALEPGLYFPPAPHAPPPLAGIGVRIEDVVAVTEGGCEVLSAAAPVERRAVERAVNGEAWEGGGDAASAAAAAAAV
jgi:Xaa-Pro aminopeptidase